MENSSIFDIYDDDVSLSPANSLSYSTRKSARYWARKITNAFFDYFYG